MAPTPLKIAIVHDGRSQREIAAQAGIDETYLSRIVNGHPAGDGTRENIARALCRTIDDLWPTTDRRAA